MTAALPPAGWYPDPSVARGQRYFDGFAWTNHYAATLTLDQRSEILEEAIFNNYRWARVESRSPSRPCFSWAAACRGQRMWCAHCSPSSPAGYSASFG